LDISSHNVPNQGDGKHKDVVGNKFFTDNKKEEGKTDVTWYNTWQDNDTSSVFWGFVLGISIGVEHVK